MELEKMGTQRINDEPRRGEATDSLEEGQSAA